MSRLTRDQTLSALQAALEPLADVLAMWEGSSVAFGRNDEWSDIDLPPEVIATREPLFFPRDLADLAAKRKQAEALLNTTLAQIDLGKAARQLG
jgi:hypothetical protein